MRPFAISTIILSLVTFILSFLCIFAGNKPGLMPTFYLISLNTTGIGASLAPPGPGGVSVAHELGLADFYSLFALHYCEGFYETKGGRNTTYCSPRSHRYTPGESFQRDLNNGGSGITLAEIHWPTELDVKFRALYDAIDAVIAIFSAAIFFSFLTILGSLWWLFKATGRCAILSTAIFAFLSSFMATVAAAITTAIIYRGVDIFNTYSGNLGAVSLKGHKYLAIAWASMACAFLAWILSTIGICFGARRRKRAENHLGEPKHG